MQADNVKAMSQNVQASLQRFWTAQRLHQLGQILTKSFFTLTVSYSSHYLVHLTPTTPSAGKPLKHLFSSVCAMLLFPCALQYQPAGSDTPEGGPVDPPFTLCWYTQLTGNLKFMHVTCVEVSCSL